MKPLDGIRRLKESGKPVIGGFPLYPPLELFHSMGLAPVVLWGFRGPVHDADRHIQNFACSVARRLAQVVINDAEGLFDGIFFYNACDTLRNLPEILREGREQLDREPPRMFRVHVPMVPAEQTDATEYLRKEIRNLILSLESAYGVNFSEESFAESVALYESARSLCLQMEEATARGGMTFSDFCGTLMKANFLPVERQIELLESKIAAAGEDRAPEQEGRRVIASGILPPPPVICRLIDEAGLKVVGNDIAAFHRSYARVPQEWSDASDYYVRFYQDHFPCTTLLYSADARIEAINGMVTSSGADGFLFIGEKFCEYEYFELPYLEEKLKEAGVSVLSLEVSIEDESAAETYRTRIDAFAEVLAGAEATVSGTG